MRINKYLTEHGFCSRREADKLIAAGKVKINKRVAVLGDQVKDTDEVFVDGKAVKSQNEKVYIMYNKPRGIVCTTDKSEKDNIIDAIHFSSRIFPIGRLDKDSTGLILLTSDGDIVNKILRAQFGHEKEYWVNVDKPFDDEVLVKMSKGVNIGDHVTLPCKVKRVNRSTFLITITEGKNRQIRRMCEAFGLTVRHLKRLRIMNIVLGDLPEGTWQYLPQKDLNKLLSLVK